MSSRSRVKLDLGPHGKVLASVHDFNDARDVAAGRLNVEASRVQLYVSDGKDLWELHPSAFQDVVAESGVIVAKALNPLGSSTRGPAASASVSAEATTKIDSPRAVAPSSSSLAPALERSGPSTSTLSSPSVLTLRRRASPSASSSSTTSTSSSASSSSSLSNASSSSLSSSSASSSSSDQDRRSESVQDVTATSATVRTVIGPNGVPVSSKERWDPKTHRLMFEKLNEIISSETIYYTRKYTEERFRIFQLLIDNYGDMGVKGNFLRGRTAQALISRVSGVLRTARERGQKIKQPFKFFFPNKKDDFVSVRSATVPAASTASTSTSNGRAVLQRIGNETRAQTLPVQAKGPSWGKGQSRAANTTSATATPPQTSKQGDTTAGNAAVNGAQGQGRDKGKGKAKQAAPNSVGGQTNPPEIRRKTVASAAIPPSTSSPSGSRKRAANGTTKSTPPQSRKQKPPRTQPRPSSNRGQAQVQGNSPDRSGGLPSGRGRSRSKASLSTPRRGRSASPRPSDPQHHGDDDEGYPNRWRERSPRRERDTWTHSREEPGCHEAPASRWDEQERRPRPPPVTLPRRPTWTDDADERNDDEDWPPPSSLHRPNRGARSPSRLGGSLFRADTRSPPLMERRSPTPRGNRWKGKASPRPPPNVQMSPSSRGTAVGRALENLAVAGADAPGSPRPLTYQTGARERGWGTSANRSWNRSQHEGSDGRRESFDLRRSVGRQQHELQERGRRGEISNADSGWPSSIHHAEHYSPASPHTPPRSD